MATATLARILKLNSRSKWSRFSCFESLLDKIESCQRMDMISPDYFFIATSGVRWALETGRLPADVEQALKSLTPYELSCFFDELIRDCNCQNDVPRYLISRLSKSGIQKPRYPWIPVKLVSDIDERPFRWSAILPNGEEREMSLFDARNLAKSMGCRIAL